MHIIDNFLVIKLDNRKMDLEIIKDIYYNVNVKEKNISNIKKYIMK